MGASCNPDQWIVVHFLFLQVNMRPGLQLGFGVLPLWIQLFLQGIEGFAVIHFLQVAQLVRDDVVDAGWRRLDQAWVQRDHAAG